VATAHSVGATMNRIETSLSGVCILEPRVFGDERGFFMESYNERVMAELGISERFVQDNHSFSAQNVLRGLHYQLKHAQGKLVRVAIGEILDVAVDLRKSSESFGKWEAVQLSGENKRTLWIPVGFAHGFRVVSESAHVLYKTTDFYYPELERTVAWNDPDLKIDWQLRDQPIVSSKDQKASSFRAAEKFD
jgi:dTDP-4-dehydrorhamnose 3,5-epimerase